MDALLLLAVLLPAAAALGVRVSGERAGTAGLALAAVAAVPPLALLVAAAGGSTARLAYEWLPGPGLDVGLRLDGLSAAMGILVALAGLAVLTHSRGYFAAEERSPQAIAGLLAFLAAMQALVFASNLLTLLIFWEIVGALSARLIAHNRHDPASPAGAIRAFLTTRTADFGLYAAVAALYAATGDLAFDAVRPEGALGAFVGVGLVVAAAGKSAQLPFQTWLGGAMAGPTPVSALLHSATMVAAGVYLLLRSQELLAGWPLAVAGWLGAITALAAAYFALAQRDLKQILAASTTSQLGLMFVAAGAGVPGAALFHLFAHAAGKAGLFLGAGLFQKRRDGTSLERLGGVGREDRAGFWGFAICAASIAAVPPLAAFWSKDAILAASEENAWWFALVLVASAGTAAYMLRAALTLWRGEEERGTRPPGRKSMLAGVFALAGASLVLGVVHTPVGELIGAEVPSPTVVTVVASVVVLLAGVAFASGRVELGGRVAILAERQLYTNAIIGAVVHRPVLAVAAATARVDDLLDGLVDRIGRAVLGLAGAANWTDGVADERVIDAAGRASLAGARLSDSAERHGIDAAVDGLAHLIAKGGGELPRLQSGQLYIYLRNTFAGIVVLTAVFAIAAIT